MSKEFLREGDNPTGLINLESYLPYLEPDPSKVPILLPLDHRSHMPAEQRPRLVHQHLYFPEADFTQPGVDPTEKNWMLSWLRRVSYNQVIMRRAKEIELHADFEEVVEPPEDIIVYKNLEDLAHLDIIGAATIGKIIVAHPEITEIYLSRVHQPARPDITPTEKVEYFDSLFERSLDILRDPFVTPERVITSGLKRMAVYLGHKELEHEADVRIKRDGTYYPLRMPALGRLYDLSNHLLLNEDDDPVSIVQPAQLVLARALQREVEVVPTALQTEAETVELQAA